MLRGQSGESRGARILVRVLDDSASSEVLEALRPACSSGVELAALAIEVADPFPNGGCFATL
jgi:hypothetical protein